MNAYSDSKLHVLVGGSNGTQPNTQQATAHPTATLHTVTFMVHVTYKWSIHVDHVRNMSMSPLNTHFVWPKGASASPHSEMTWFRGSAANAASPSTMSFQAGELMKP